MDEMESYVKGIDLNDRDSINNFIEKIKVDDSLGFYLRASISSESGLCVVNKSIYFSKLDKTLENGNEILNILEEYNSFLKNNKEYNYEDLKIEVIPFKTYKSSANIDSQFKIPSLEDASHRIASVRSYINPLQSVEDKPKSIASVRRYLNPLQSIEDKPKSIGNKI